MESDHSHNHYNKNLKPIGRALRNNMTKAEASLWKYALKNKQRGYTFNRQRPVLSYVADFMCKDLKLIIEVDGSTHDHPIAYKRIRKDSLN
jgi:very-short-patch-repair endonuclease